MATTNTTMPKMYHSVPQDEEISFLTEKKAWSPPKPRRSSFSFSRVLSRAQRHWTWLAHAVLLSISMTLFTLSFCVNKTIDATDPALLVKSNNYSPLFPAVKYMTKQFTGLGPITHSPYAGYGEEVDRAWDLIANDVGDIMISEEERVRLGLSPDSLKIQHPKTGKWGYRAGVEVFHQLHCLNLVRQAVYKKEYYGNKDIGGDVGLAPTDADVFSHVDHCIDALRQSLMCNGDVSVFTFKTFPELADQGIEGDWPDFDINHTCRDFNAIKKFNNDHVVAWDHDA